MSGNPAAPGARQPPAGGRPGQLLLVVGARPNFVKAGPVLHAARANARLESYLVHTGQHYDAGLSELFFEQLELPEPDVFLGVGSASHAQQTAEVMSRLEPVLVDRAPDCVVVFGDVNSTVAAALTAAKLQLPVAHVEAGLRSFDATMPEEINRRVTDCLSELLFTTEESGNLNLRQEGVAEERIYFVGNTMVDSLRRHLEAARSRKRNALAELGIDSEYALLTLHRPSNVDEPETLRRILEAIGRLSRRLPIVFPLHPRTRQNLERAGLETLVAAHEGIRTSTPLSYLEFLGLMDGARLVLTDSGGIQEETTVLGVPCLTLRDNTERPVTVSHGTNRLVGNDPEAVRTAVDAVLETPVTAAPAIPPLWDGAAAPRIVSVLADRFAR